MYISVKVKPNSKEQRIEKLSNNSFVLRVKAPAKENKANAASIELLSKFFDKPKSLITIIKGKNSKNKIFNIIEEI